MVSRRQCLAVSMNNSRANSADDPAEATTSNTAMGSSLSTLVINRCWLSEGMNINELVGLSE